VSRFLFAVPPLAGHTLPTVAVGEELARRGHDVAWAGHRDVCGPLLPAGAAIYDAGDPAWLADVRERSAGLRGAAAFQFLWEAFLIPLAEAMLPAVDAAIGDFRPDVVIADQQALAGAVAAQRRGLPWATSATTSAELADPFALMPKLGDWARGLLLRFQRGAGLDGAVDPRFSPHLVLAFTTEALAGPALVSGDQFALVGPSLGSRRNAAEFPWSWLDPGRRLVLVSLGTVSAQSGDRFFAAMIGALAPIEGVQAVLVASADRLPELPPNVLARPFVPQLELIARAAAVVSHAGHNTVCEALAHGVPLVVAPIRDDQPIIAQQVTDAGAGVRVRYGRAGAAELREAITAVLGDPSYRDAAGRIAASFRSAGGAAAAADRLEKLT
jgi:UDP:flavonoid glycosyltransferase YjiC (YdhE family)